MSPRRQTPQPPWVTCSSELKFWGLGLKQTVDRLASVQRRAKNTTRKHSLSKKVERPGDFPGTARDV